MVQDAPGPEPTPEVPPLPVSDGSTRRGQRHGRRVHRASRAHLRDAVRPSPARAEPHDSAAWLPLPDLDVLPEPEGLIATTTGGEGLAAAPTTDAPPPSPARARPHDAAAWLPLPVPSDLPSIAEMLTPEPWDLHTAVRPSPGRADAADASAWLPLATSGAGAPPPGAAAPAVHRPVVHRWTGWVLVALLVVASVVVAGTILPRLAGSAASVFVSADGVRTRVDTSAASVGELLTDRGVRVGPDDRVVPARSAPVPDGGTVLVLRAFPVTVDLDGVVTTVATTRTDPTEFVRRDLGRRGRLAVRSAPDRLTAGSALIVRTRHTGSLAVDGLTVDYDVPARDVTELLAQYNVELGPEDYVTGSTDAAVARDAALADGTTYRVVRVGRDLQHSDESYTLPGERRPDPSMAVGQSRLVAGVVGTIRTTFEVTLRNGEEVARRIVSKVPVVNARADVTYYGTRADPMWDRIAQCESGGNWSVVDSEYSGGLGIYNGTWDAFGGRDFASNAGLATREEQIIVAERIKAGVGISGWGCAHILGYVR